jgi:acetyltransferase-like isoleucine patch superfamily enzyme
MFGDIRNHFKAYLYTKRDPKRKNWTIGVKYEKYGFSVGKYSYGYEQFFYDSVLLEKIGAFCSIAKNVTITGMNHPTTYITTNPILYYKSRGFITENKLELIDELKNRKVIIQNDVWIGSNVTILPSVKIGNGAIVGAGSVITKDVPDYAIVVGIPAKIVKYRFEEEQISILNQSAWWEWSDDRIKKFIDKFTNTDDFFALLKEGATKQMNISVFEKHRFGRVENTLPAVKIFIPAIGNRQNRFKDSA